jgi:hypothetical protein
MAVWVAAWAPVPFAAHLPRVADTLAVSVTGFFVVDPNWPTTSKVPVQQTWLSASNLYPRPVHYADAEWRCPGCPTATHQPSGAHSGIPSVMHPRSIDPLLGVVFGTSAFSCSSTLTAILVRGSASRDEGNASFVCRPAFGDQMRGVDCSSAAILHMLPGRDQLTTVSKRRSSPIRIPRLEVDTCLGAATKARETSIRILAGSGELDAHACCILRLLLFCVGAVPTHVPGSVVVGSGGDVLGKHSVPYWQACSDHNPPELTE